MPNFPSPFCINHRRVRAIVLGADPTAFDKKGELKRFNTVFGIGSGDPRYFASIMKNLETVGLGLGDVCVQNLIQEYQDRETGKNPKWRDTAAAWIPVLKKELDALDGSGTIPVLVTAEDILRVLWTGDAFPKAHDLYFGNRDIPIRREENALVRPLVPFFRHWAYTVSNHPDYCKKLIACLPIQD